MTPSMRSPMVRSLISHTNAAQLKCFPSHVLNAFFDQTNFALITNDDVCFTQFCTYHERENTIRCSMYTHQPVFLELFSIITCDRYNIIVSFIKMYIKEMLYRACRRRNHRGTRFRHNPGRSNIMARDRKPKVYTRCCTFIQHLV